MTYWTAALLALALAASPAGARTKAPPVVEGQPPQQPVASGNYPYQLFVPKGYLTAKAKQSPVLIFLPGSGERGAAVAKVKVQDRMRVVSGTSVAIRVDLGGRRMIQNNNSKL